MAVSLKASSARVAPRSGDPGGRDLGDDGLDAGRVGAHRAGAGHVADRAVAHDHALDRLVRPVRQEGARGQPHAVAAEDVTLVGEVDGRHLHVLAGDVLPDVHLRPVGDGEDAHVLAAAEAAVVERPQLRSLRARLPLAELVAQGEDALLGAGLLLVAPGAAEDGVELVLGDGIQERRRLEPIARGVAGLLADAALVDGLLHGGHDETLAQLGHAAVAELEDLREVVARVDVHDGEREPGRPEGLLGEAQEHDGVLAAREEEHGPLELGGHLAHDEDGLRLEGVQVADAVTPGALRQRSRFDHRGDATSARDPMTACPGGRGLAATTGSRPGAILGASLSAYPDRNDRHYRDSLVSASIPRPV